MRNGRHTRQIRRIRNEILVALEVVYPAALLSEPLLRSLLTLFPTLEFEQFKRDLHYLLGKGYVERVIADGESDPSLTPWRRRWFRLTTSGMDVADRSTPDPALED